MFEKPEDAAAVIRQCEEIIRSKQQNIVWMAQQQVKIFRKLKEREKFVKMFIEFGISRSTMPFKITIIRLIDEYYKVKNSSLSLNFLKKH